VKICDSNRCSSIIGSLVMRWDNLKIVEPERDPRLTPSLFGQGAVVRTFDTPEFRGITFYEVQARSIINRVPEASRVPFRWTINPYRGCSHACFYCFARNTHTFLDLDSGEDFNSQIVVKVNAEDLLRKELAAKSWRGEHIAMGTNVDPYQRAEGRYRLMRGILSVLLDRANPFSILTKGSLILRDLDLLQACAEVADIGTNVSVGVRGPGCVALARTRDARSREAARGVPDAERGRSSLRGPDGPDHPVPHRLAGTPHGHGQGHRGDRGDPPRTDRAASSARRPRMVHGLARRASSAVVTPFTTMGPCQASRIHLKSSHDTIDCSRAAPTSAYGMGPSLSTMFGKFINPPSRRYEANQRGRARNWKM